MFSSRAVDHEEPSVAQVQLPIQATGSADGVSRGKGKGRVARVAGEADGSSRGKGRVSGVDLLPEGRLSAELSVSVTTDPEPRLLAAWDHLVASTPGSDVTQLSAWAGIRRLVGYEPLYVLVHAEQWVLGGATLLRRRVRGIGWLGYLPYGPLLREGMGSARAVVRDVLADALVRVAREQAALFVQPPERGDDLALELLLRGFRFSSAGIAPSATLRVDLTRSEEELRAGLSRRLRTWTRRWADRGVRVRIGDERDLPVLARLAASTARFHGFTPFSADYLTATYRMLADAGQVVLLIGEVSGTPMAAELLTGCGGVLKSRVTGLDRSSPEAGKLNVASAMIWEAMRWGKAHGYRYYDFGGLRSETVAALRSTDSARAEALAGPDQFKVKFGGEVLRYPPAVELISSRPVRWSYDLFRRGKTGQRVLNALRQVMRGTG